MVVITVPSGIESVLSGAVLLSFSLLRPRRIRRVHFRHPVALAGLLVELIFLAGGAYLVFSGVAEFR